MKKPYYIIHTRLVPLFHVDILLEGAEDALDLYHNSSKMIPTVKPHIYGEAFRLRIPKTSAQMYNNKLDITLYFYVLCLFCFLLALEPGWCANYRCTKYFHEDGPWVSYFCRFPFTTFVVWCANYRCTKYFHEDGPEVTYFCGFPFTTFVVWCANYRCTKYLHEDGPWATYFCGFPFHHFVVRCANYRSTEYAMRMARVFRFLRIPYKFTIKMVHRLKDFLLDLSYSYVFVYTFFACRITLSRNRRHGDNAPHPRFYTP